MMSTFGTRCCDYTCNGCDHEWTDTKQRGYETTAYDYSGCPECHSKDCGWKPHEAEPMTEEQEKTLQTKLHKPGRLGKPPKEFVEQVLGRIHENHKGHKGDKSSINLDW